MNSCLTQIKDHTITNKEEKDQVRSLFQELKARIDTFCSLFLGSQAQEEIPKHPTPVEGIVTTDGDLEPKNTINELNKLIKEYEEKIQLLRTKLSAEVDYQIKCLPEKVLRTGIGGDMTHLALKNKDSFLIGTDGKGFLLREDKVDLYTENGLGGSAALMDMVYVRPLDCYFIAYDGKLYRKGIDDKPPEVFMELQCGYRPGACLRYSPLRQRLVINKDFQNISVVNLSTKEIEIEVEKEVGDEIMDFKFLNKDQNLVVSVTRSCHVVLYHLNFEENVGSVVNTLQEELIQERGECPRSIAVCQENHHLVVEIGTTRFPFNSSRLLVLKVEEDKLIRKASLDVYEQKIGQKDALECLGCFSNHIMWVGLSIFGGFVQVYDFDTDSNTISELEEKRVTHQDFNPVRIHRLGDEMYYIGNKARVRTFGVQI